MFCDAELMWYNQMKSYNNISDLCKYICSARSRFLYEAIRTRRKSTESELGLSFCQLRSAMRTTLKWKGIKHCRCRRWL